LVRNLPIIAKMLSFKVKYYFLPVLILFGFLIFFLAAGKTNKTDESPKASPVYQQTSTITELKVTISGEVSGQKTEGELNKVTRVVDGDTIEIEGGIKVRYIGIDTPETVHPDKGVQCFGSQASNKNRELVEGKNIRLEEDISQTDKYGRLLRYVYIGEIFVNDYLVRNGFAYTSSYPPDVKYQAQFGQAQQEARENNRGLWSACAGDGQKTTTFQEGTCLIKGNVSSSGEKIYHLPDQKYYDKTVIDEGKGERWFCSEEEAKKAGWRKSKI